MDNVYRELVKKLDSIPQGFPSTEDGLELKILRWIYTPEEAAIALELPFAPETAEAISKRLNKTPQETATILEKMAEKEEIMRFNVAGTLAYALPPFYPGITDSQAFRKDKTIEQLQEYAKLFIDYFPTIASTAGSCKPSLTKVVPVSTAVEAELKIHRLDDVRRIINEAKSIHLMECVCRKEKSYIGRACNHSLEVCMMISDQENIYSKWPHGRDISKEEALEVMEKAEKEGLVHTTYNANDSGGTFLCACCRCCSIFLSALVKYKAPYILTQSRFVARIDDKLCKQSGICAKERCPMGAIVKEAGTYRVQPQRCIGCGVCLSTCPTGAIALVPRPEAEQEPIPENLQQWGEKRAAQRWGTDQGK